MICLPHREDDQGRRNDSSATGCCLLELLRDPLDGSRLALGGDVVRRGEKIVGWDDCRRSWLLSHRRGHSAVRDSKRRRAGADGGRASATSGRTARASARTGCRRRSRRGSSSATGSRQGRRCATTSPAVSGSSTPAVAPGWRRARGSRPDGRARRERVRRSRHLGGDRHRAREARGDRRDVVRSGGHPRAPDSPPASFDLVFSEGVLHHTPSTEAAFKALARLLRPGGEIMIYVYRRKAPAREFVDDYVRERIAGLPPEEAWDQLRPLTRLGQALAELEARSRCRRTSSCSASRKGVYDVQRLVYWHFAKLFWNPTVDVRGEQSRQLRLVPPALRAPAHGGRGARLVRGLRPRRSCGSTRRKRASRCGRLCASADMPRSPSARPCAGRATARRTTGPPLRGAAARRPR